MTCATEEISLGLSSSQLSNNDTSSHHTSRIVIIIWLQTIPIQSDDFQFAQILKPDTDGRPRFETIV
jgi:hypothetical protein